MRTKLRARCFGKCGDPSNADLFGITLIYNNRWSGFKGLRARWLAHLDDTRMRPLLLVDEAQELPNQVLTEMRLLPSSEFDSRVILSVVLAGDSRPLAKLRSPDLQPIASRVCQRFLMARAEPEELTRLFDYLLDKTGYPGLTTPRARLPRCRPQSPSNSVKTAPSITVLTLSKSHPRARLAFVGLWEGAKGLRGRDQREPDGGACALTHRTVFAAGESGNFPPNLPRLVDTKALREALRFAPVARAGRHVRCAARGWRPINASARPGNAVCGAAPGLRRRGLRARAP